VGKAVVWRWKSLSEVQGQSPGGSLGEKTQKYTRIFEIKTLIKLAITERDFYVLL